MKDQFRIGDKVTLTKSGLTYLSEHNQIAYNSIKGWIAESTGEIIDTNTSSEQFKVEFVSEKSGLAYHYYLVLGEFEMSLFQEPKRSFLMSNLP